LPFVEFPHGEFPQFLRFPRSLFLQGPPARCIAVNPCPQFAVSPLPQFAVSPQWRPAVPARPQFPQLRFGGWFTLKDLS